MTMVETDIPTAASARQSDDLTPLAVTVAKACELTGLGRTSIWAFLRDGKLEAVRPPGIRRTLISYRSLAALFSGSLNNPVPRVFMPLVTADERAFPVCAEHPQSRIAGPLTGPIVGNMTDVARAGWHR